MVLEAVAGVVDDFVAGSPKASSRMCVQGNCAVAYCVACLPCLATAVAALRFDCQTRTLLCCSRGQESCWVISGFHDMM
jgi:hypothetical protein